MTVKGSQRAPTTCMGLMMGNSHRLGLAERASPALPPHVLLHRGGCSAAAVDLAVEDGHLRRTRASHSANHFSE